MRRLFVLLVLPSLLLAPTGARGEIIERVVAKVNGQIITLSEFQSRQIAAAQGARVDPATVATFLRQNNARILQDAIDEILIMQKAEDAGMKAPSQWIDEAIAGIRKENNITSDEQMQDALDREGITLAELRRMQERHRFVGDVRAAGLFLAIELVKDRQTKEPLDGALMKQVYADCVQHGLLAMTYTPHVRLQPALTIDEDTALEGLAVLDGVFRRLDAGGRWR